MTYIYRMRFILILLTVLLALPINAQAQGVFSQNNEDEQSLGEVLGIEKPKEGRKSTGDIKKDIALRYYDECVKHDHAVLSKEGQDILCGCTSNGIEKGMSTEAVKALYEDNRDGRKARDYMMLNIYAPCMKYPIRDLVYDTCMDSKSMQSMSGNKTLCKCSADTITRYMNVYAKEIVQGALQTEDWYEDPIGNYVSSENFAQQSNGFLRRCIEIHVHGYD